MSGELALAPATRSYRSPIGASLSGGGSMILPSQWEDESESEEFSDDPMEGTKNLSSRYRETALAVLQKCLPVRPTPEFAAILHDTVLHLRLVNGAPFPSRNLGPWMTVFAHPNRGG